MNQKSGKAMPKAKLSSIQLRFRLLQSATLLITVWLLAGAAYLAFKIQEELAEPLDNLNRALTMASEVEGAADEIAEAALAAHDTGAAASREALAAVVARLSRLRASYAQLQFTGEEGRLAVQVSRDTAGLIQVVEEAFAYPDQSAVPHQALRRILVLHGSLEQNLHQIHALQLDRARASHQHIRWLMLWLIGLLVAAAIFTAAMIRVFRSTHQRHIWRPLEELRQMVLQMRRGNLNIRGPVPDTVELAPLFHSFIEMAAELREMRHGLEQKVLERTRKLEEAQQQLLRAAKLSALGQLVSGVAHEVNNPLTSILGFSEVALARTDLDPRLRGHLEKIRAESLRLRNVVANLTHYSHRGVPRMARIDLRDVLERLAELRRYQLRVSNIRLHYTPPAEPVWVRADADQLLHVFFSLVLNAEQAIKSVRTEGDIWLVCAVSDGQVRISVRDNGSGVPADLREKIFEPFFTTKPMGQGTGMGLTVALSIVRQHHGEILVESEEGHGSTFTVVLPEDEGSKTLAGASRLPQEATVDAASQGGRRALVLDDEPAILDLLEQFLRSAGWQAQSLTDPSALEKTCKGSNFTVVLCDLKMPGRSGLEILRWLREHRPELARRFILMTGDLADADAHSAELAGVTLLQKPFTLPQFFAALRQVWNGTTELVGCDPRPDWR
jgi:signal transduction histidine kinase/ActR/RegA family two-component response regulator